MQSLSAFLRGITNQFIKNLLVSFEPDLQQFDLVAKLGKRRHIVSV